MRFSTDMGLVAPVIGLLAGLGLRLSVKALVSPNLVRGRE